MIPNGQAVDSSSAFGSGEPNFRTLPTLAYIGAVAKRNAILGLTVMLLLSPAVLIAVLLSGQTFDSSMLLRLNYEESLNQGGRGGEEQAQAEVGLFLARQLDDRSFIEEIAKRLPPTEVEDGLRRLMKRYPSLQFMRWFLRPSPRSDDASTVRIKELRGRISVTPGFGGSRSTLILVNASGPSVDEARQLVSVVARLLIETFYQREYNRARNTESALETLAASEDVKNIVEKAIEREIAKAKAKDSVKPRGRTPSPTLSLNAKQKIIQDKIDDINVRIRSVMERRARVEATVSEMVQRYGPYHPQRRAVENELEQLKNGDDLATLNDELRRLQDEYEKAGGGPSIDLDPVRELAEPEDLIQGIQNRRDLMAIEATRIFDLIRDPSKGTWLNIVAEPSLPLMPSTTNRLKYFGIGLAAAAGLSFFITILREWSRQRAEDAWRITWILNRPALLVIAKKHLKEMQGIDRKAWQSWRSRLLKVLRYDHQIVIAQKLRRMGLWLRFEARGQVVLFAPAAPSTKASDLLRIIAATYARDYAGRTLLIDFISDGAGLRQTSENQRTPLLDVILGKVTLDSMGSALGSGEGYDVIFGRDLLEGTVSASEVLSSVKYAEFVGNIRRVYHRVLILGPPSQLFVEQSLLLKRSADMIIVVDSDSVSLKDIRSFRSWMEPEKIRGFVLMA